MNISATALNKRPGTYLEKAIKGPVIIEKSGRPSVVMISYERYQQLEDAYWGELANIADKEKSLSTKESMKFLLEDKD
jgi:prevent-host-death family protein